MIDVSGCNQIWNKKFSSKSCNKMVHILQGEWTRFASSVGIETIGTWFLHERMIQDVHYMVFGFIVYFIFLVGLASSFNSICIINHTTYILFDLSNHGDHSHMKIKILDMRHIIREYVWLLSGLLFLLVKSQVFHYFTWAITYIHNY